MALACALCDRDTPDQYVEKHHLTPKSRKGKECALFCCDCGDQVHKLFNNKELHLEYNTIEKLKSHESVRKWIKWVRNRPHRFGVCMKKKKRRL